jgi:dnd system-associated protein 4
MKNVRREVGHEVLVKMLAERAHPRTQRSLFPTMRELMCFAAAVGFQQQKRKPLQGKTAEIDARNFENSEVAMDMLYLVALADAGDVNILQPDQEEKAVAIFEEYANGGFETLNTWMAANAGDIDGDQALFQGMIEGGLLRKAMPPVPAALADVKF